MNSISLRVFNLCFIFFAELNCCVAGIGIWDYCARTFDWLGSYSSPENDSGQALCFWKHQSPTGQTPVWTQRTSGADIGTETQTSSLTRISNSTCQWMLLHFFLWYNTLYYAHMTTSTVLVFKNETFFCNIYSFMLRFLWQSHGWMRRCRSWIVRTTARTKTVCR